MWGQSIMSTLSDEQLEKFEADGCLVIPDFLSAEQVAGLRTRIDELLAAFDPAAHPLSLFKTGNADQDDYFLTSGDKVRFFLEAAAVDADGSLLVPKDRAVNKIGHALHELEPVFATISVTDRVRTMVRQLNMTDPVVLQSMAILKQPRVGGAVPPHQDSTFLYTHTPSAIGFWFALEDCTLTNGCLSFAKGSHKTCPVTHRFVRQHSADGKKITTAMERLCDGDNDTTVSDAAYEPATCKAGSLVLIHGAVMHKSEHNMSDKSRMIYTFHCVDLAKHYDERNWLQPGPRGFTHLFV